MRQKDFMSLYDNLGRYATYKARRFVHDESLRIEAIDESMAEFVDSAQFTQEGDDLLSPIGEFDELLAWGKGVISHTLKDFVKKKKELKPTLITDEEQERLGIPDSFHGMELNE